MSVSKTRKTKVASLYLDFNGDPARTYAGNNIPTRLAYTVDADATTFARAIEDRLAGDAIARLHRRARENEWPRILAELVLPVIHA